MSIPAAIQSQWAFSMSGTLIDTWTTHQSIIEVIATIGMSTAYISRVFSYCTHSSEEGHRALRWPKAQVLITSLGRLPGKIF